MLTFLPISSSCGVWRDHKHQHQASPSVCYSQCKMDLHTRSPRELKDKAMFTAHVDLPTPPFSFSSILKASYLGRRNSHNVLHSRKVLSRRCLASWLWLLTSSFHLFKLLLHFVHAFTEHTPALDAHLGGPKQRPGGQHPRRLFWCQFTCNEWKALSKFKLTWVSLVN